MRSLVPSLARRIPPIQITLCSAHGGTLGLNRTKQGIDSPVNQTSLMAKISLLAKLRKNMIVIPLGEKFAEIIVGEIVANREIKQHIFV